MELCFLGQRNLLLGFSFCIIIRWKKHDERTQADRRNIQKRADIPTKLLGNRFENEQGRIARSDKEHIDSAIGGFPKYQIDTERDRGKHEKRDRCRKIILFGFGEAS